MFDDISNEKNLLILDYNQDRQKLLSGYFGRKVACTETASITAALECIKKKEYAVILAPFAFQVMNGLELIPHLQSLSPHSTLVIISENDSAGDTVRAFRAGAFEVIQKPFEMKKIESVVERAFEQFEMRCLKARYQSHLEELVAERTAELDKALEEIENSYRMTLKALVQALETRDLETHGHSERVVTFSLRLGHELGLETGVMRDLELGALLHDIGKIGVPDAILRKPAKLNTDEWELMKHHPLHGQKILRNISFLSGAVRLVTQHHEKWDGSGYPYGLRGEDIEVTARIFAVADTFDAMTSDRIYRKGCSYEDALTELERCSGTQFDPTVIAAFKQVPKDDWQILRHRSVAERPETLSFQAVVSDLIYAGNRFELVH